MQESTVKQVNLRLPVRIFGVFVVLFTVLPTLQLIALGFLTGFNSEQFYLRLWATCFMWLAPAIAVSTMAPLLVPRNKRLLFASRVALGVIGVVTLSILGWLSGTDRMDPALLVIAVGMFVIAWSGTFSVQWLMRRQLVATAERDLNQDGQPRA